MIFELWMIIGLFFYPLHGFILYLYHKHSAFKDNWLQKSLSYTAQVLSNKNRILIENIFVTLIEIIHVCADPFQNWWARWKSKSRKEYQYKMDILILLYFIITLCIFLIFKYKRLNSFKFFYLFFFIYRLIAILFSKLQEITHLKDERSVSSFNRIFFISIINFIELVFHYSYFYFCSGISNTHDTFLLYILNTLKIFTTQGISDNWIFLCPFQQVLIISQMILFIFFFIVFFSNINNLRYRDENKKNNM